MSRPLVKWRTDWNNGVPTYIVTFSGMPGEQRLDIERLADEEGIIRSGDRWRSSENSKLLRIFEAVRSIGADLEFEPEGAGPFNLQRLHLQPETRERLENIEDFRLDELAGYSPVQAEGSVDGEYFYFRARGSHWRIEVGGNESGTKGPKWWYEEYWPNETGFGAGYLSDEDAIRCILKAVEFYRAEDRSRFEKDHPDYERTILDGWSVGALTLPRVVRRLGITGEEAVRRAKGYGIELPYLVDLELKALDTKSGTVVVLDKTQGIWIDAKDEDE